MSSPTNSAVGVTWDLSDLYQNVDDAAIEKHFALSLRRAKAFEKKYRGKIKSLKPTQAKTLLAAVVELEKLSELMDR